MNNFNKLDPSALKAFYFAAYELNFTTAAEKAGLTQSGVSQHIKKLETELSTELFIRARRQIKLTEAGQQFLKFVENYLESVDRLVDDLQTQQQNLAGEVRYAMPDSCLFSPHFGQLLDKRLKHFERVSLKVKICDSEDVIEQLLSHQIDFGFVTKAITDHRVEARKFVHEEYVLVTNNKQQAQLKVFQDFAKQSFIRYPGADVLLEKWFQNEFGSGKKVGWGDLEIKGSINSISGAIQMVEGGLGMGFFQKHCVQSLIDSKKLFVVGKSGHSAKNPIQIVTLKEQPLSRRVNRVIETFEQMKTKES